MNCKVSEDCMMRYFDGALNDIEAAQFKQHLKSCEKCNEGFESMNSILGSLIDDIIEPPEDFEEQVMKKVNLLEVERKKKSAKFIAFLYSIGALILITLTAFLISDLRGSISSVGDVGGSINSVSDLLTSIFGAAETIFNVIINIISDFLQVVFVVIKAYYYVFIMLAAVLFAIEWMFVSLVRRNNGGMVG